MRPPYLYNGNIIYILVRRHLYIETPPGFVALRCKHDQFAHYKDIIMGTMVYQITSLTIVNSTAYSGADHGKHQRSASLAFVWEIHRWPVNSPHKWPVTQKYFHLMTSSWWELGQPRGTSGSTLKGASNAELWCFICRLLEQVVDQTVELPVSELSISRHYFSTLSIYRGHFLRYRHNRFEGVWGTGFVWARFDHCEWICYIR